MGRSFLSVASRRYGRALGVPGAARFFIPAAVARLGVAMSRLAVLWAVHGATGSFGQAGVATGAFAIADAAVGPQIARLIDRWGQRRVVSVTASAFAGAAIGLVAACAGDGPLWLLATLAGVAGAAIPPVGALAAARWRHLLGSTDRLPAALSLEAAVNDLAHLIGPVLVTTLSATVGAPIGLVLAVALVTAGVIGLLSGGTTEPPPSPASRGIVVDPRLVNRRFMSLFVANLAMGLFFGGAPVTITAFAIAHEAGALAGPIAAVSGVVSLTAGLVYGTVERGRPLQVMIIVSLAMTLGVAALALVPNVPFMFVGYALVGGCVAPILIPAAVLLQRSTDGAVYTQAMTWINSASAIGIATAAPLAGYLIQQHGWPAGFLLTAALTACLPLTLVIASPHLRHLEAAPDLEKEQVP